EYAADRLRLVKQIRRLSSNPEFKFCVSSRPWNIFLNAFGTYQDKLVLEDFTRQDIREYVYSELGGHTLDKPELGLLCDEVVEKAQGVFLWVFLAVRSLIEGLEEDDNVRLLRRRVDELQAKLEDYFDLILSRVDKVYRHYTATALYIAHKGAKSLLCPHERWDFPSDHCRSFLNLWLLQNGGEERDFALKREVSQVSVLECQAMVLQTNRFISACCKDLLSVPKPLPAPKTDEQTYLTQYKVDFLHRIVFEYLDSQRVAKRLRRSIVQHASQRRWEPMLAIARLSLVPVQSDGRCRFLDETLAGIEAFASRTTLEAAAFKQLDIIAARYIDFCFCHRHESRRLLEMLISRRHYRFAAAVMQRNHHVALDDFALLRQPFLTSAMGIDRACRKLPLEAVDQGFIEAYLSSGVNVNSIDETTDLSPWEWLLRDWQADTNVSNSETVWQIARLFIKSGANLSGAARGIERHSSIIQTLSARLPAHCRHELHTLVATRAQPHVLHSAVNGPVLSGCS
ncbi:hypothetical protein LTR81_024737, partial [Elasticomyces elasticus]